VQVLALAAEPSLSAALNMMDGWEVTFASEVEHASQLSRGAAIVLVGGGTDEGLRVVEELRGKGVTIPAVIIGDEPPPEGARYPVVVPPFTLEELRALVEIVVRDSATKAVLRPTTETTVRTEPAVDPYASPAPVEPERHLKLAPAPEHAPAVAAPPVSEPVQEEPGPVLPPPPPPSLPPAETPPPVQTPAAHAAPAPPERSAPIPPVPAEAVIVGPSRGQAVRRGLLRRRTREEERAAAPQSTVTGKLSAAAGALSQIEAALEEIPVLANLRDLTQALITEVVEMFSPQLAGLYLPAPEGYRVWASHGFSSVERTMTVAPHQPLFADILSRHEAVLIEPLDLAQSLVSGIGGARTNGFLAAPIEAHGKSVGVLVVGREHFANEDLSRLESLADEASMGLAVALGLDQLRGLL